MGEGNDVKGVVDNVGDIGRGALGLDPDVEFWEPNVEWLDHAGLFYICPVIGERGVVEGGTFGPEDAEALVEGKVA